MRKNPENYFVLKKNINPRLAAALEIPNQIVTEGRDAVEGGCIACLQYSIKMNLLLIALNYISNKFKKT